MTITQTPEVAIDPEIPVIDAHHHLFDRIPAGVAAHLHRQRLLIDDYAEMISGGHNVIASVSVDARIMYRVDGPVEMRPVGETEFVNGQAAMAASGLYGPCRVAAGIVGYADLRFGDRIRPVLEAHIAAAPQRFRGIRQEGMWDADHSILGDLFDVCEHQYLQEDFRQGFAHLAPLGLSFDAFILSPQLGDVLDLVRRFPETNIILCHTGQPMGVGRHSGRMEIDFPQWKKDMRDIASFPNTSVKLGGLGTYLSGSPSYRAEPPVGSAALAAEWRPHVEAAIELFGAARCMFESNLPTDGCGSFLEICNAYKIITAGCTHEERLEIFADTARRIYRLELPK